MPVSTKFRKVPYKIVGDSFISSAKDLSSQYTKGMVPIATPNSLSEAALFSWPGLKVWSSGTRNEGDRGIHKQKFNNKGWKVSGTTLYSFDSAGTQTNEGTISGSDLVTMEDNGTTLLIVANGVAYTHDGATLSTLSLTFTPVQVGFLNERFILLGTNGFVYLSSVNSTNFTVENPFNAKSQPDDTVGIRVYDQYLFIGGENTFEPWQDIGSGNPPFARINGVILEQNGLYNKNCFASTPSALYILGNDRIPARIVSFQSKPITNNNPGVAELFQVYNLNNAYMQSVKVYGQYVIMYFVPEEKKCWCYSETVGLWFELDHDIDAKMYLGKTLVWLFDKWLVGDRQDGTIYELDYDTYQNNSVTMVRERVFRPLAGETVGSGRANMQMKVLKYALETGVGVSSNPVMTSDLSTDGGRSFNGRRKVLSLGNDGDYTKNIEHYSNAKFKDLTARVRYTENTRFTLYDSSIYVRESGR